MPGALVQCIKSIDNDTNTSSTTNAITLGTGSLLACVVAQFRSAATPNVPTAVQLDGTTSLTLDISQAETDTSRRISLFSLPNAASGAHTVSLAYDLGPNQNTIYLLEISGILTSSPQDGAGTATDFFADTTTPSSGNFTASLATDFWIAAMVSSATANPATVTAGSGWAIPTQGSETNGAAPNCVSGVETQTNPGTTTLNGTWATSASRCAALVFAYKAIPSDIALLGAASTAQLGTVVPTGGTPYFRSLLYRRGRRGR